MRDYGEVKHPYWGIAFRFPKAGNDEAGIAAFSRCTRSPFVSITWIGGLPFMQWSLLQLVCCKPRGRVAGFPSCTETVKVELELTP